MLIEWFLSIKSLPNLLFSVLCLPGDQSHPVAQPTINPLACCICWARLLGRAVFPPWNKGPNSGSYNGCGKGVIWERVWFLEAVPCCPILLFVFFFWFYDCILVMARQHWLHLLEADVPINLDFRDWKLRRVHDAIWKKQMKISSVTFKFWISPELGSWRWMSF